MKDRGAIKWSSLMLPEHKELLEEYYREKNYLEKPILAEDKCEEINKLLIAAFKKNLTLKITIYHNHSLQTLEGMIKKYKATEKRLKIVREGKGEKWVYLDQIIDVEIFSSWY